MNPVSGNDPQSSQPPQHGDVQMRTFWNLRFRDSGLEDAYMAHRVSRDTTMSRIFVSLGMLIIIGVFPLNLIQLEQIKPGADTSLHLLRPIAYLPFWFIGLYLFSERNQTTRYTPLLVMFCTMYAIAVLYLGQWEFWVFGSSQAMLGALMVVPMMGAMPWRLAVFASLWGALVMIVPEWLYQPNTGLRNLHIVYILFVCAISLLTAYVHEYCSRQQFVINNSFLQKSRQDQLTGLFNRRELAAVLPRMVRQAARDNTPLAIAMLDVDHFKKYNDHYGHGAGDNALAAVAHALIKKAIPRPDFVARYGGEEFVAIWANPDMDAVELGEGLRSAVADLRLPHAHNIGYGIVTISVGVSMQTPDCGQDQAAALLTAADQLLYRAKANGRNRVEAGSAEILPVTSSGNTPAASAWQEMLRTEQDKGDISQADAVGELSRADYQRWHNLRGFSEIQQVRWMGMLAFSIVFIQILIAPHTMPEDDVGLFSRVLGIGMAPYILLFLLILRNNVVVRHLPKIMWAFILPLGLMMCYILNGTLAHGHFLPYDFIIILIFIGYFSGGHTWISAAFCGWCIGLTFLGLLYHHGGSKLVESALVAVIVANLVGMLIAFTQDRRRRDIFFKKEKLEKLASHDPLTGLANRHGFENYIINLLPLLHAREYPVTVAMVDIDHFKKYNDHYGHEAGDSVLIAVGKALTESGHRAYDIAVRLGGEEFALIWYQAGQDKAQELGQRVCQRIRQLNIPHIQSPLGTITASVGLASGVLPAGCTMKQVDVLLRHADTALYRAKAAGRNHAEVFKGLDATQPLLI